MENYTRRNYFGLGNDNLTEKIKKGRNKKEKIVKINRRWIDKPLIVKKTAREKIKDSKLA